MVAAYLDRSGYHDAPQPLTCYLPRGYQWKSDRVDCPPVVPALQVTKVSGNERYCPPSSRFPGTALTSILDGFDSAMRRRCSGDLRPSFPAVDRRALWLFLWSGRCRATARFTGSAEASSRTRRCSSWSGRSAFCRRRLPSRPPRRRPVAAAAAGSPRRRCSSCLR